ncbi:diacylglycerol/lipid kinase family protein [Paracoccus endophyticus]|uniref:diacylglycerol/lipid kinase family protein n=1 Tax=Paracoccus endophyticus TaxID=2233774 RepID=UPI001F0BCDAF|nr:diacylglycerol kinase family protein [Paracoccus endophyticus]
MQPSPAPDVRHRNAAAGMIMPNDASRLDLSRARVCVILNPRSGRKDGGRCETLLHQGLAGQAAALSMRTARRGGDLPRMAAEAVAQGYDLIVAVGGDGTQAAVAGAVAGTDVVMGVIPGGTFNFFARDAGVGDTVEQAIQTLRDGRVQAMDVGQINDTVFLNNVSLGAYPRILERREAVYRRWGRSRIAAYLSALGAIRDLRHPVALKTIDDGVETRYSSALVFVAKSAVQLEQMGLEGADAIRAGHLAIFVARARKPRQLIGSALRLALGFAARGNDFDLVIDDDLVIETVPARRDVAHDGERTRMTGPFHLRVRPGALRVLVPAGAAESAGAGGAAGAA